MVLFYCLQTMGPVRMPVEEVGGGKLTLLSGAGDFPFVRACRYPRRSFPVLSTSYLLPASDDDHFPPPEMLSASTSQTSLWMRALWSQVSNPTTCTRLSFVSVATDRDDLLHLVPHRIALTPFIRPPHRVTPGRLRPLCTSIDDGNPRGPPHRFRARRPSPPSPRPSSSPLPTCRPHPSTTTVHPPRPATVTVRNLMVKAMSMSITSLR